MSARFDWRAWRDAAPPVSPDILAEGACRVMKCPPGAPDALAGHKCSVCGCAIEVDRPWCVDCSHYARRVSARVDAGGRQEDLVPCAVCRTPFLPKARTHVTCSERCGEIRHRRPKEPRAQKAPVVREPVVRDLKPCATCPQVFAPKRAQQKSCGLTRECRDQLANLRRAQQRARYHQIQQERAKNP